MIISCADFSRGVHSRYPRIVSVLSLNVCPFSHYMLMRGGQLFILTEDQIHTQIQKTELIVRLVLAQSFTPESQELVWLICSTVSRVRRRIFARTTGLHQYDLYDVQFISSNLR